MLVSLAKENLAKHPRAHVIRTKGELHLDTPFLTLQTSSPRLLASNPHIKVI